jgi:hypothetical protein
VEGREGKAARQLNRQPYPQAHERTLREIKDCCLKAYTEPLDVPGRQGKMSEQRHRTRKMSLPAVREAVPTQKAHVVDLTRSFNANFQTPHLGRPRSASNRVLKIQH